MDWKIELIFVPVTDVDRAKDFYLRIGFNADHDQQVNDELRFVQMTPPGSACSIAFGTGLGSDLAPGSQNTIQVVVPDTDEALAHLQSAGVEAHGVADLAWDDSSRSTTPTATRGRCSSCRTTARRAERTSTRTWRGRMLNSIRPLHIFQTPGVRSPSRRLPWLRPCR